MIKTNNIELKKSIQKHSGELGKFQLWRKLPKSVMYQTYLRTLDYLEYSNKIAFDIKNKVGWIHQPKTFKKFIKKESLRR